MSTEEKLQKMVTKTTETLKEELTKKDEMVGSLLVHKTDLQELSEASKPGVSTEALKEKLTNELKNDEMMGSLLVHKTDLQELSEAKGGDLVRRATDHINKMPAPTPEEVQTILDDV
jgi:phage pi2 protein 07